MTHKILIIAPSWIGDCVMAQPLFRRLHEHHPDLELHVYASAWTFPLLSRMPEVQHTHLNPFGHGELRLLDRYKQGKALRKLGFDQVIVLPNSLKSALVPFFSGIKVRTGYLGESRRILLNDIYLLDEVALPKMVDRFFALAEPYGFPLPTVPHPRLSVDPQAQAQALQKFGLTLDKPVVAFCPGAEYGPAKQWPAEHFAALAKRYHAEGKQIWLFGSKKDAATIANELNTLSGNVCINLCGITGLDEAIDLLGLSELVVCNDSGLMHVAAALKRPLVALYGSSSPDFTPPLSNQAKIMTLNLDCSPCFERVCPLGHTQCLNDLSPVWVHDAGDELLSKNTIALIKE
ncbi:MAG: lipopolysaccharide heptosyltransferase II [Neisseriaceae bacterium]|nr:lipopolysaccharide heptosyltransferase II [Neisseriaceae bacterium]